MGTARGTNTHKNNAINSIESGSKAQAIVVESDWLSLFTFAIAYSTCSSLIHVRLFQSRLGLRSGKSKAP